MASVVLRTTLQIPGKASIPVMLKKVQPNTVKFGRASADGNKIVRSETDAVTGAAVTTGNIQRGKWDGDVFTPLDPKMRKVVNDEARLKSFVIDSFMPLTDVPWERANGSFYLMPQGDDDAFVKLHDFYKALVELQTAAFMTAVISSRNYQAIIWPKGGALYVNTLIWPADWSQAREAVVFEPQAPAQIGNGA